MVAYDSLRECMSTRPTAHYHAMEPIVFERPDTLDISVRFKVGSQFLYFTISRFVYAKYFAEKDLKEVMTQLLQYVVLGEMPDGISFTTDSTFMMPAPIMPEVKKIKKEELPLCHCLRTLWK